MSSSAAGTARGARAPRRPVLSTLHSGGDDPRWDATVEVLPSTGGLIRWLLLLLARSRGRSAVILRGTVSARERYRDLLGALLLRRAVPRRHRPLIVVSDATVAPGSASLRRRHRLLGALAEQGSRLLVGGIDGPGTRWAVLSRAELVSFPATWGVDPGHMVFTPFSHTLWGGGEQTATSEAGYVFSGGDSMRDYDLLAAATAGTGLDVRVASRVWSGSSAPHVTATALDHDAFVRALAAASVVVVPLAVGTRSAGQQSYLNAMVLGKAVIVTDAPGVRDYVVHGVTGVVVAPEPAALRAALLDACDPARKEHYAAMGRAAREAVLADYTEYAYRGRLLDVAGTAGVAGVAG